VKHVTTFQFVSYAIFGCLCFNLKWNWMRVPKMVSMRISVRWSWGWKGWNWGWQSWYWLWFHNFKNTMWFRHNPKGSLFYNLKGLFWITIDPCGELKKPHEIPNTWEKSSLETPRGSHMFLLWSPIVFCFLFENELTRRHENFSLIAKKMWTQLA